MPTPLRYTDRNTQIFYLPITYRFARRLLLFLNLTLAFLNAPASVSTPSRGIGPQRSTSPILPSSHPLSTPSASGSSPHTPKPPPLHHLLPAPHNLALRPPTQQRLSTAQILPGPAPLRPSPCPSHSADSAWRVIHPLSPHLQPPPLRLALSPTPPAARAKLLAHNALLALHGLAYASAPPFGLPARRPSRTRLAARAAARRSRCRAARAGAGASAAR